MRTEIISRAGIQNHRHRRTLVIRHAGESIWERLLAGLSQISRSMSSRLRPIGLRLTRPRVLLIVGAFFVAFSAVTIYEYNQLASEIEMRLQSSSLDNSIGIFTSPFKVSAGDRLPMDELTDYLRAAGYQQRASEVEENGVGSFTVEGNAVEVFPGATSSVGNMSPVRVATDKSGRVVSLTDPVTGQRVSSALIEGELLATVRGDDRRKKIAVQFSDIPDNLRNAIVAAEDRRFFSHNGIDFRGILRALKEDLDQGEIVQGGSTLTQQLIKNDFLTRERTVKRKLKEAAMAMILESKLSKQEIFSLYCNDVYLGQSGTFAINGFAQAAQVYFDKDLNGLTLSEAAFLAGLIRAPNRYSAYRDQPRVIERRNQVLDAMVETGAITVEDARVAKLEQLQIKKHQTENDYGTSYFIDYVQRFVDDRYGPTGLMSRQRIVATMDPRLQRAAYGALKRQTDKLDRVFAHSRRKGAPPQQVQGALVALNAHTGEVLAMVGGRSYDESQLNRATDAKRQPGSAFKPFVYATALGTRSYTAASLISDTPKTFTYDGGRAEYTPSDYHGGFTNRNVTLREALSRSLNVPTVELAMSVGLSNVAAVAETSGLERPRVYPSMALGTSEVTPLQLASAYTAFANGGTALRPIPVKSIGGATTSERVERLQASSAHVFSPQVAYLMTNLLQSVVDEGTASRIRAMGMNGAIAGKTGTSSDGWFVGYTPGIVCAVWVGFDDNRDLGMKASDAALPMWADFIKAAIDIRPELGGNAFTNPGGLVTVEIDPATGCLASPESIQRRQEMFISGTEPFSTCISEAEADADLIADQEEQPPYDPSSPELVRHNEDYDKITVEVCELTGLIASPDCPHKVKRTFELGKEPIVVCRAEFHGDGTYDHPARGTSDLDVLSPMRIEKPNASAGARPANRQTGRKNANLE
jgi:penicillin-binding protein 1B